jgi:hypothetical protein
MLLVNIHFVVVPNVVSKLAGVPIQDRETFGYISTDSAFTRATIVALSKVDGNQVPVGTAHSRTNLLLKRWLYKDGALFNSDDNQAFLDKLGNPSGFYAVTSKHPAKDAAVIAAEYSKSGFVATVVEHYDQEMKEKMYFVSMKDSTYNPHWVIACRRPGPELGPTTPWDGKF